MEHSPRFLSLVQDIQSKIQEISIPEYQQIHDQDSVVLIDIREDHEWEKGHIPKAIHLGRGILERDIERLYPNPETTFVLYCGGGFRSILAAESLQKMGYTQVKSLIGGWREWNERGLPKE